MYRNNLIDFNTNTICVERIGTCFNLPKTAFYIGSGLLIGTYFFKNTNKSKVLKSKRQKV